MSTHAFNMLQQEAESMQCRLDKVKPFTLFETVLPAAATSMTAQQAIDSYLVAGRHQLKRRIKEYLSWLAGAASRGVSVATAQRRFTHIRLHFNSILAQFDIFADALTQRSESDNGLWLAGLDAIADDALRLPGNLYPPPPVVCYLDRGAGAAIRRARTRLPGGGENPAAMIRIPRERMVGSGIASSLVHEVGHQGQVQLDLQQSLREVFDGMSLDQGCHRIAWPIWKRWISEIISDFWAIAHIGVGATMGLIGVVSLPRAFVCNVNIDGVLPFPLLCVLISCAMGNALYPDPQWKRLENTWLQMYPPGRISGAEKQVIDALMATRHSMISLVINHRSQMLKGRRLKDYFAIEKRTPQRLRALWLQGRDDLQCLKSLTPTMAFAVIGQAKQDAHISAKHEDQLIIELLRHWAIERAMRQRNRYVDKERGRALSS